MSPGLRVVGALLRGFDALVEHLQHELVDLVPVLPDLGLQRGACVQDLQQDLRLAVQMVLRLQGGGLRVYRA